MTANIESGFVYALEIPASGTGFMMPQSEIPDKDTLVVYVYKQYLPKNHQADWYYDSSIMPVDLRHLECVQHEILGDRYYAWLRG